MSRRVRLNEMMEVEMLCLRRDFFVLYPAERNKDRHDCPRTQTANGVEGLTYPVR